MRESIYFAGPDVQKQKPRLHDKKQNDSFFPPSLTVLCLNDRVLRVQQLMYISTRFVPFLFGGGGWI